MAKKETTQIKEITNELVINMIHEVRGQKVMLDFELAELYGYETKRFNEQIKRNIERFPEDFMFQLTSLEVNNIMRSQIATSRNNNFFAGQMGGTRKLPYAFTEQGIYMLMTVLKGETAIKQSIALIKIFKTMKDYINNNSLISLYEIIELTNKVNEHSNDIRVLQEQTTQQSRQLQLVMENFIDPSKHKEILIFDGQKIEAEVAYKEIYKSAKHSIIIVDDYISARTLKFLKVCEPNVEIIIYSDNVAKDKVDEETLEIFKNETGISIEIKPTGKIFHDRFIFIDHGFENEKGYQCGSSSKDSGNAITVISLIEDNRYNQLLLEKLNN